MYDSVLAPAAAAGTSDDGLRTGLVAQGRSVQPDESTVNPLATSSNPGYSGGAGANMSGGLVTDFI